MNILVVDDEESMRHMLSVMLAKQGYGVKTVESGEAALKVLSKEGFDFVLCDIRMPGMGGDGFLKAVEGEGLDLTVIMMSAFGTIETAVECMKLGAYDYISKPFKSDEIILTIRKAEERERLKRENRRLKGEGARDTSSIVTEDAAMKKVLELVEKVSDYDSSVLITGESGTGKELVARALHYGSSRSAAPFIAVNCGAIPEQLIESELFGHVKGAFTDAVRDKDGLFLEASGGTIFLDEIGELPLDMQVKLLRVLEQKEVRRVGGTRDEKIDCRVVAATARDLASEIEAGRFRDDLFYRLNVITVALPPLRERKGDIGPLTERFIARFSEQFGKGVKGISAEALTALMAYNWPGNIRELENVIERAAILEDSELIGVENLPFKDGGASMRGGGGKEGVAGIPYSGLSIKRGSEMLERELIARALKECDGNKSKAARVLEISHRALLYKIKDYNL